MSKHRNSGAPSDPPRFPGRPVLMDGSEAIVAMETAASDAAGAYPITPSTQMGEGWAAAVASGKANVFGRRLLFFEPEGEHAAAAVTTGMSLTGLRTTNFSSGQSIAYMHESLYAAVGKRLTYVLNVACRAMTKHTLNVHAGHDDYHAVDDTGFFQIFAKNVTEAADFNLIAHRIAELSLTPGICAQDGFLTSHVIESALMPEDELVYEYLGDPADMIDAPTPAQRLVFGEQRRRIPELYDLDYPSMLGVVQNQDSYAQGVAAQRPFYFDHIESLTDRAFDEYAALTGRRYARAMGYRLEDADYVIAGMGSMTENAEAVADHLREVQGLKVGVLNVAMFRPFPSDLITALLRGKKAVAVLERLDQPLAVDAPLLREIRAAMGKGLENGRGGKTLPFPGVAPLQPKEMPSFYSGSFGMGSRDLQPTDLIAAVQQMVKGGRRQFYLGIDFVRRNTRLPKLQIWQEQLLAEYPHLAELALDPAETVDLMPKGTTSIRIHSVGGWGAITMGKNLAVTASELLGLYMKANPKYGSEKKGQPTTFYASLAPEPVRLNCELKRVDVVLSPDPNVFLHSNPFAGLDRDGVFLVQSDEDPQEFWNRVPRLMQQAVRDMNIRVFLLDGFRIAAEEASNEELRYRMQGTAFMGAFFRAAPMVHAAGLEQDTFFKAIGQQLEKKFGHLGARVVEDNLRVIRRGYEELRELDLAHLSDEGPEAAATPHIPERMAVVGAQAGPGHAGRFWEQVGYMYATGQEGIADPFAAISMVPAVTSTMRDMTNVRFEVPHFIAENCTGCSQCWTQCPDTAIPGLVTPVEEVLDAAVAQASRSVPIERLTPLLKPLGREARRLMKGSGRTGFAAVLQTAFANVLEKAAPDPDRRRKLESEFTALHGVLSDFPLARTGPFWDGPEATQAGSGGLLSVTVNPVTCKGCNICVDVCPDGALVTVKQTPEVVDTLRRNWQLWEALPDTDDHFVRIASLQEGIGVLSSMLLKKKNYLSMAGSDGACMGCGEKTVLHLVVAAVHAHVLPEVAKHLVKLEELIARLDAKARGLVSSDVELDKLIAGNGHADIPLDPGKQDAVQRIAKLIRDLKDLKWRYEEGPSGKGRAAMGFTNSTGCSSVWGSTYPFNPYPFPWVNHLFQDAPSVAIGVFEGHMRKMADGFKAVRRAVMELEGGYDPQVHEELLASFDWQQFDDEEFALCPPILAVGGDGAMMDIGFQNLSRLLAAGKPLRVVVLDTQVYSNTGGQACTSGYTGQVSDMAVFGKSTHGKTETRKELALLAMAHRGAYVVQSTQSNASHLLGGVLRGLGSRRPAIFVLHCPCPPEHGIADDAAVHASKLMLESRAFPVLEFDPDAGRSFAECLSLEGNPSLEDLWPSYTLAYVDDDGQEQELELPVTIADWAASEGRFKKHFRPAADPTDDALLVFHEYLALDAAGREGHSPFVWSLDGERHLRKLAISDEIVQLADDRLHYWAQLRELAGLDDEVAEQVAQIEVDRRLAELASEYEAKLAELREAYPQLVARRIAEGLLRTGDGSQTVDEILRRAERMEPLPPPRFDFAPVGANGAAATATLEAPPAEAPPQTAAAPTAAPAVEEADDDFALEASIETVRCTSCNECTNLNNKMFAYNPQKQAYIKDVHAGTFQQLVKAAEACPVAIIHPGTPVNPKEKDLDKWVARAAKFNG